MEVKFTAVRGFDHDDVSVVETKPGETFAQAADRIVEDHVANCRPGFAAIVETFRGRMRSYLLKEDSWQMVKESQR